MPIQAGLEIFVRGAARAAGATQRRVREQARAAGFRFRDVVVNALFNLSLGRGISQGQFGQLTREVRERLFPDVISVKIDYRVFYRTRFIAGNNLVDPESPSGEITLERTVQFSPESLLSLGDRVKRVIDRVPAAELMDILDDELDESPSGREYFASGIDVKDYRIVGGA